MFYRRLIAPLFFIAIALLQGCGSQKPPIKIGIDPYWYPSDFGAQNSYVNGFIEEVLLDVAKQNHWTLERINVNWDNLLEGLNQGHYQAILSSLPPYEFRLNQYDFSHNVLKIGPVLIIPEDANYRDLEAMNGKHIGVIAGDPVVLLLQKHEGIVIRSYPSAPDLLEAITDGQIEGAILERVFAGSYVQDLFAKQLKIVDPPLTDAGLHLVVLKGKQPALVRQFNKEIDLLKETEKMDALLKKWQI